MAKKITSGTNILPNNPMEKHGLLAHLKEVKGTTSWYEFNLRCLVTTYPDDKVFKGALAAEQAKAAAAATPPSTATAEQAAKVTPATDATTAKTSTKGNGNKTTTPQPSPKGKAANKKEVK